MRYVVEFENTLTKQPEEISFQHSYRRACARAQRLSEAHGVAFVVALKNKRGRGTVAAGRVVYRDGYRDSQEGKVT